MGGSQRVPLKNIKILAGKPLIWYTITEALRAKTLDRVIVSTDHPDIAALSRNYGAEVPFTRPADISEDVDTVLVLQHAVKYLEKENYPVELVVTLQPTSPFRIAQDIDACVQLSQYYKADSVISVSPATQYPHWMFKLKEDAQLEPFMDLTLKGEVLISQNLPELFYLNGAIYVTKRDVIMNKGLIFGDDCRAYVIPIERALDLEVEFDFEIAECLMKLWRGR